MPQTGFWSNKPLVSVSWCAGHFKGRDPHEAPRMRGVEHAEWLEDAVAGLYFTAGYDVIVACTHWNGIIDVENTGDSPERDVLWRLLRRRIPIIGTTANPNHQVGAALCIRLGLEYASHCGYEYLIHTAEDVLPHPGSIEGMCDALVKGAEYVGEQWGHGNDQLNAQFFACRVATLVGPWDACCVTGHGCIERYLAVLIGDRPKKLFVNPSYRHTHDKGEWERWRKEQKGL
jgi:hypothetical protein